MIDEKRIAEIEARANAANKPPWLTKKTPKDDDGWATCQVIAMVAPGQGIFHQADGGTFVAANQTFMAHARQDVPDLIAALRELQAENERLTADKRCTCWRCMGLDKDPYEEVQ